MFSSFQSPTLRGVIHLSFTELHRFPYLVQILILILIVLHYNSNKKATIYKMVVVDPSGAKVSLFEEKNVPTSYKSRDTVYKRSFPTDNRYNSW